MLNLFKKHLFLFTYDELVLLDKVVLNEICKLHSLLDDFDFHSSSDPSEYEIIFIESTRKDCLALCDLHNIIQKKLFNENKKIF